MQWKPNNHQITVGFDTSQTGPNKAGCGHFAQTILAAAQSRPNSQVIWHLYPKFGDSVKNIPAENNFWKDKCLDNKLGNVDILHSNSFWCPEQLKKTKLVYTLYDLSFLENYTWHCEENRIICFDGVFKASLFADGIIAISEFSKKNFLEVFPHYNAEHIEVIYPCSRFAKNLKIADKIANFAQLKSGNFWLSVGTIEPRKNQKFLLEVYAEYVKNTDSAYPLVFAGQNGWLMEDFHKHILALGLQDHVLVLGYVNDAELVWLYKHCYTHLYPSLFEGFGLPVLEAIQFARPSVASSIKSIVEIIPEDLSLSPYDKYAWVKTMLELHHNQNLVNHYISAGARTLRKFNWQSSAIKLENFYQQVISK